MYAFILKIDTLVVYYMYPYIALSRSSGVGISGELSVGIDDL